MSFLEVQMRLGEMQMFINLVKNHKENNSTQ